MRSPSAEPTGTALVPQTDTVETWTTTAAMIDKLNRTDPHVGLETAREWLAREQAADSSEGIARATRSHAHARRFLGQYDEAIAQYEEAEARFYRIDLPAEAARTQIGHVTALRYKGRYNEAVELGLSSYQFFEGTGDRLQAAKLANSLGTVYRPMGRLRDAARSYRESRAVLRRLRKESTSAEIEQNLILAEQNLGNVLADLGQYDLALRHLRAAERIGRQLGLLTELAMTLGNIGILLFQRGDYGRSLQAFTEARQIYESLGVERGTSMVDMEMLPTCIALNLREESDAAAERAIAGLRRVGMPFGLATALLWAARLAEASGSPDVARERTIEARTIFAETGNELWTNVARLQEARLLTRAATSEPSDVGADELWRALAVCRVATSALEEAGAADRATTGLLVEGAVLGLLNEHQAAQACYERAGQTAERLNADHLLYQVHEALGSLLESSDPDTAMASYRRAIDALEAVRSRAVATELKVAFLADKADVYERLVGLLIRKPSPPAVAEAYRYVERSKSRALLDDLLAGAAVSTGSRRLRVARLSKRVRDLRAELSTAYLTAYEGNAVPADDNLSRSEKGTVVVDLEQTLARASRELELARAVGSGRRQRVDEAVLADTPITSGEVLIEYYCVGPDLFAFVRRGDTVELRAIAPIEDVEALVDKLSFQIGKCSLGTEYVMGNLDNLRRGINRCLQSLYRQVIGPVEDLLVSGDALIVVPHGALHGLPFHAFHNGEQYLVDRHAITVAPSAAVMQACRQAARPIGKRAMIVGIDDPSLPMVPREVEAISRTWASAKVAQGARATSRFLRQQIGTFDVFHLATHGVFRADNPLFSSIKLADGWLTVGDVAELAQGAQLVTLSACETGVSGIMAGDEVIGLTRGLLGAGCSAVVASLWTVNDESTAYLMEHFYASLRTGEAPAVALRTAMLDIRAQYDHPFFWAPFMVIGDGLTSGN
jgi:tetratricopeptide (TPR) repeat protein